MTSPEAVFARLPLKGATLADRQSRICGVRLIAHLRSRIEEASC